MLNALADTYDLKKITVEYEKFKNHKDSSFYNTYYQSLIGSKFMKIGVKIQEENDEKKLDLLNRGIELNISTCVYQEKDISISLEIDGIVLNPFESLLYENTLLTSNKDSIAKDIETLKNTKKIIQDFKVTNQEIQDYKNKTEKNRDLVISLKAEKIDIQKDLEKLTKLKKLIDDKDAKEKILNSLSDLENSSNKASITFQNGRIIGAGISSTITKKNFTFSLGARYITQSSSITETVGQKSQVTEMPRLHGIMPHIKFGYNFNKYIALNLNFGYGIWLNEIKNDPSNTLFNTQVTHPKGLANGFWFADFGLAATIY